jgi:FixJ family two-component response regulator
MHLVPSKRLDMQLNANGMRSEMHDFKRKIYVIDNDLAFRASLAVLLRSLDYDVELFDDGEAFLLAAHDGLSGCIVLDVRLRGIGGLEIQRRLAEMGSVAPMIFITGHGDVEMAVKAMKAKAVDFLTKPVREQDLLDAISVAMQDLRERELELQRRMQKLNHVNALTPREREIFVALCSGKLAKQIAHELGVSEATVKVHRRNMMQKLGVSSISQLILQFGIFSNGSRLAA